MITHTIVSDSVVELQNCVFRNKKSMFSFIKITKPKVLVFLNQIFSRTTSHC